MRDLILSVVKDRNWSDLDCYAVSANACGFDGRKVMLVDNVRADAQEALKQYGFEVYSVKTNAADLSRLHFQSARYFLAAEFLANHRGEFRNVIWTDACDVVFQEDPVPALARALGTFQLVAVKEGWLIKNQAINDVWIQRLGLDEHTYRSMREQEVLCSGTIAGKAEVMFYLFTEMCSSFVRRPDEMQGIDQGVFNYLMRTSPFAEITRVPDPEDAFVATCGIFLAPSDSNVWTITPPYFDRTTGLVKTIDGRPFAIQHQYNRNYGAFNLDGAWRGIVERRYR